MSFFKKSQKIILLLVIIISLIVIYIFTNKHNNSTDISNQESISNEKSGFLDVSISDKYSTKSFSNFNLNINYPDSFKLENITEETVINTMGKMENGELLMLDFENQVLQFDLIDENIKISWKRFIHQPDYEPNSPSGGGNIEVNSIVCSLEDCENFIEINENSEIFRQKISQTENQYFYTKVLKNELNPTFLTRYMRLNPIENDFDGLMVEVEFISPDLNFDQKEKYLEVVDEILLGV